MYLYNNTYHSPGRDSAGNVLRDSAWCFWCMHSCRHVYAYVCVHTHVNMYTYIRTYTPFTRARLCWGYAAKFCMEFYVWGGYDWKAP